MIDKIGHVFPLKNSTLNERKQNEENLDNILNDQQIQGLYAVNGAFDVK
jgi:hypothetical protein